MAVDTNKASRHHSGHSLSALSLAALGVVYGDIGTSPLYTLKVVLGATGKQPAPEAVLGSLSLIVWTLIIITTVKYIILALRVDNEGEGGVLALMALLRRKPGRRFVLYIGMFGAALVYGDCALTPAISVLSALEGLDIISPELNRFVLPGTVVILAALFAVQRRGTAVLGRFLGPVMASWFAVLAVLGLWGIAQYPAVLWAINPALGLHFLFSGGGNAMLVLGGVFLCVTGAEALYADLGHFGRAPIRLGWCVVFPALVLNYAGQAAIVLAGGPVEGSLFFRLCPAPVMLPLVILATIATAVASHHGCLLDDTPGDPAWLPPAAANRPDVGRGIWPDLRARGELAADGCNARAYHRLSNLREPGRRLWNSGVGGHGADNLPSFDCPARDLGFAAAGSGRNWRRVCHG
jgi:KUP system potassium uptake protein